MTIDDAASIEQDHPHSPLRVFARRFRQNRGAMVALVVLVALGVVAAIGPWISPYEPNTQDLTRPFLDPFTDGHVFGTDESGRDTFSRMIAGTRVALFAVIQALVVAMVIGVPPGLVSGYFGGFVDLAMMRVTDAVQSFPPLVLAIAIVGVLGPSLRNAMLAIGIVFAPNFMRIVRASVLEVREETFIEASRSIGSPTLFILWRRVVPNILPPLLVQVTLTAGFALLAEASLSFLGLGVQLPEASWGAMLSRGYQYLHVQSWMIVFPGFTIALAVLCFNVVGDGLRDAIGKEIRRE